MFSHTLQLKREEEQQLLKSSLAQIHLRSKTNKSTQSIKLTSPMLVAQTEKTAKSSEKLLENKVVYLLMFQAKLQHLETSKQHLTHKLVTVSRL